MRRRSAVERLAVIATVAALATALGSCTTEPPATEATPSSPSVVTPEPTPTPSPTVDAEVAAAEQAVLDAYNGYWRAKVATFARPADPEPPELSQYAIDVAYTDVKANAFALQSDGVAIVGEPVLRPTVSAIDLADPGTATIVDCVDVSDWQPMFQATGESAAAPDQARRVLSTSTAFLSEGRWVIRTYEVDRGTQC